MSVSLFIKNPLFITSRLVQQKETYNPLGEHPTIFFGLVTLAHTLKLSPGSAIALFALGRTIEWIGHSIEQYQTNQVIRPRARYVGPAPYEQGY